MSNKVFSRLLQSIYSLLLCSSAIFAFDEGQYAAFLAQNQDLSFSSLIDRHMPVQPYCSKYSEGDTSLAYVAFLDSINAKIGLTEPELSLLRKNRFVVSQRFSFQNMGEAYHKIYGYDLPVFVTTDAILHALHKSYDDILMDIEDTVITPKLKTALKTMYDKIPSLASQYSDNHQLDSALADIDLYVTIAYSLLDNTLRPTRICSATKEKDVWDAISALQMKEMQLFTNETVRKIDFSQFTPRGHYAPISTYDSHQLANYFRCMMWLGRIDFILTAPAGETGSWSREDLRRMACGALLMNELISISSVKNAIDEIDSLLTFLVGESDNLTPGELDIVRKSASITIPDLFDDQKYDHFIESLINKPFSGQKILSDYFIMNPFSSLPDTLPISYRLMGQRFILDSYIMSNVVYDRIIYKGAKVWRPMPDPLDAMYVLGNDDALQLLRSELEKYCYSFQLESLRYLVDSYDSTFWSQSLYNVWLDAIRCLNPRYIGKEAPAFMKTCAWHQEKINTQLASWAQLRHDNLLYAKPSYTGGTLCSFPHSYVEPYPLFYRQIGRFAARASGILTGVGQAKTFFTRMAGIMDTLACIADAELAKVPFTKEQIAFLQKMLFIYSGSGAPPFSGWYGDLFYNIWGNNVDKGTIADVHTQSTDEWGNPVGRVLHVATGKVELGIFLAPSPSDNFNTMAFAGPCFSYYDTITENFNRLTDQKWNDVIFGNPLLLATEKRTRPDWINVYCAGDTGLLPVGRVLDGVEMALPIGPADRTNRKSIGPFSPKIVMAGTRISIAFDTQLKHGAVVRLFDQRGCVRLKHYVNPGERTVRYACPGLSAGRYICLIDAEGKCRLSKTVIFIK